MKKHQNLFLTMIVILFSVYTVSDYFQDKKDEVANSEKSLLLPLKADQVKEIEIIKSESKIKLQRSVQGWQIVEPLVDAADNEFVEDFVAAATADNELSAIESKDIAQFRLEQPLAQFHFTDNQGIKKSLSLSSKQNFEGSHYAQRYGEEKIILVTNVWATRAHKKMAEYRDRKLLRHKISSIQSMSVKNSNGQLELKTVEGKWLSPTRPDWQLDQNLVRQLIQSLVEAQADDFILDKNIQPSDLTKYSLSKPDLKLDLQLSELKWQAQLGKIKDKHRYFYVQDGNSFIYQVSDTSLARLQSVKLIELRDAQSFFQFDKSQISQISYQGQLKKWQLEKNKDDWKFILQNQQGLAAKAPQLIESLLFSRVGQFLVKQINKYELNNHLELKNSNGNIIWSIKWSDAIESSLVDENKKMRLAQTSLSTEIFALSESTIMAWGLEDLLEPNKK